MIAVLLGLFAALCWSVHDLIARRFAGETGPYRMGLWVMLMGAALLVPLLGWRGSEDLASIITAMIMGLFYACAIGGLLKAFSLAPVSVVGPLTAGYPALVVLWGVMNGLTPSLLEWLAAALVLAGAVTVARSGASDGGMNLVARKDRPVVIIAAFITSFSFAACVVLGQKAAVTLGEFETTFISRFPAALLLWPATWREHAQSNILAKSLSWPAWAGITAMAACDVLAVSAINYSGQFPNKAFAAMAISAYGALSVLLAMTLLRERVSLGQWVGIAMIVAGVGYLGIHA